MTLVSFTKNRKVFQDKLSDHCPHHFFQALWMLSNKIEKFVKSTRNWPSFWRVSSSYFCKLCVLCCSICFRKIFLCKMSGPYPSKFLLVLPTLCPKLWKFAKMSKNALISGLLRHLLILSKNSKTSQRIFFHEIEQF